jgi:hypothetical protein
MRSIGVIGRAAAVPCGRVVGAFAVPPPTVICASATLEHAQNATIASHRMRVPLNDFSK